MSFNQNNGLRYFQFDSIKAKHAVFTRHGGVSPEPWNSLNVGGTVGDEITRVRQNRVISFEALGCMPDSMFDVWQVHSAEVVCADAPRPLDEPYRKADIILTDNPEVTLFMRFADCVPLLMYDPYKAVIGIAHAGWMGTLRDVAGETIKAMQTNYGCKPANIVTGIGPSIGPDHYEVGEDVITQVHQKFGDESHRVLEQHGEKTHFNLWEANRMLLRRAGVEQIELAAVCTACNTSDWYSHRAEKGRTGRFGALISLQ